MVNTKQQLTSPRNEQELQQLLDEFYKIAQEEIAKGKTPKFKGLLEIAGSDVVIVSAIHKIKSNRGSKTAGTDGKTINDILTKSYNEVIQYVKDSLLNYKPVDIRRVHIPKLGKKEKRPLGIPAISDRIIQECIKIVIEPILEAQFFHGSYGFRPYRDTKQAMERCVHITNRMGYNWVVEGDIKGFFDNVNHSILLKQLWSLGIQDRRILMIIKEMLKAGIMNETTRNEIGTPQGGIISPLLANVYLNKLDWWITREWEEKKMRNGTTIRTSKYKSLRDHSTITKPEFYVRYADDWVLFTNSKENAEKWKYRIDRYLKDNLQLELSTEKTLITNLKKKPIKFLGFKLKMLAQGKEGKYIGYMSADTDKMRIKVNQIVKDLRKLKYASDKNWLIRDINVINSKIRGVMNYYSSAPSINRDVRKFSENLKYTSYKTIKKYGAKWTPANQCYNLASIYPERTEQVPAVKIDGNWIGILNIGFATWIKENQKNPKETPCSVEGRAIRLKDSGERPLLFRTQWLLDSGYIDLIQGVKKSKLYNFEFFMNRSYAFNRDKGKCKVCGEILFAHTTRTHHINNKLPTTEINKMKNLATLCNTCHDLIHMKELEGIKYSFLKASSFKKLDKYRSIIHGLTKSRKLIKYKVKRWNAVCGETCTHGVRRGKTAPTGNAEDDCYLSPSLDPEYAKRLGVNIDELLLSQPDTGEQALEICEALVRSGAIDIVVVDSVAALVPKAEIEGEMGDSHVGLQARLMSQALRKLSGAINKSKTNAIFINQIREKVGVMFGSPEVTPGGRALKFYASVRIDVRRGEAIKQGTEIMGNKTRIRVVKNKVAPPFRLAEVDIMYGFGISQEGELVDIATEAEVIQKSGSWYAYEGERLGQGRENAKQFLAENPAIKAEIDQKVRAFHGLGEAAEVLPGHDVDDEAEELELLLEEKKK